MDILSWLTLGPVIVWLLRAGLLRGGEGLTQRDKLPTAALCYCSALLLWPFSAAVWTQLGNVLGDCKAWNQARICFALARRLRPDWIEARLGLGVAALVLDADSERAHGHFLQAYFLRRGVPFNLPQILEQVGGQPREDLDPGILYHAAEQIELLVETGRLSSDKLELAEELRERLNEPEPMIQRSLWLAQPQAQGSPLLPVNAAAVETDYAASGNLLTWYDGLLRPDVLAELLEFCQYSTIWHYYYKNGYLGAHLDDGMSCPLLYQIADALKLTFPAIFADTRLVYLWAFKCLGPGSGVALHHDSALINVNFWLTPDQANLNPTSGGICVYPKEPPQSWDLERYRIGQDDMQDFVSGVEPICVPYRQNRVVIFNSRLFHATQPYRFASGSLNQRLNITLLFGHQPLRYHQKQRLKC